MENWNPITQAYHGLVAEGRKPLELFSGNPNQQGFIFPQQPLIQAYQAYFQNQTYQPNPKGLLVAREAISQYYKQQGITVSPEQILLTAGTSESFLYLFNLLAEAGENILAPQPAYPIFEHVAALARVELKPYRLDESQDWTIDLDSLKAATDAKTRAILLVSPNNPTGAVATRETIREVLAWCQKNNLALIADEVFSEFYFQETFPRPMALEASPLCFTLNGISKMLALPALKLSWIVVSGETKRIQSATDCLETMTDTFLSCHFPIQSALPTLFTAGQGFMATYRQEVKRRRDLAVTQLQDIPGLTFVEPQGGFYMMIQVNTPTSLTEEEWVIRLMKEKGVFVHPGYFFDYESGIHFVISFLTEPELLTIGLEKIREFVLQGNF